MNNDTNLTDRLRRRQRVDRLKRGIITALFVWILLASVLLAFLMVKAFQIQKQVNLLASYQGEISALASRLQSLQLQEEVISTEEIQEDTKAGAPTASLRVQDLDEENLAGPEDAHQVYLTFDDGPSENTDQILDILQEHGVQAAFFVIGREDEASVETLRRIAEEGHTLGMHSYSHKYATIYRSLRDFETDFFALRNLLRDVTGEEPRFYRFPGSSSNQVSNTDMDELIGFVESQGVTYLDWNVSAGDATAQELEPEEILGNVLEEIPKYKASVVLLHEKDPTVEALGPLLDALEEMGAEVLPVDEATYPVQYARTREDK